MIQTRVFLDQGQVKDRSSKDKEARDVLWREPTTAAATWTRLCRRANDKHVHATTDAWNCNNGTNWEHAAEDGTDGTTTTAAGEQHDAAATTTAQDAANVPATAAPEDDGYKGHCTLRPSREPAFTFNLIFPRYANGRRTATIHGLQSAAADDEASTAADARASEHDDAATTTAAAATTTTQATATARISPGPTATAAPNAAATTTHVPATAAAAAAEAAYDAIIDGNSFRQRPAGTTTAAVAAATASPDITATTSATATTTKPAAAAAASSPDHNFSPADDPGPELPHQSQLKQQPATGKVGKVSQISLNSRRSAVITFACIYAFLNSCMWISHAYVTGDFSARPRRQPNNLVRQWHPLQPRNNNSSSRHNNNNNLSSNHHNRPSNSLSSNSRTRRSTLRPSAGSVRRPSKRSWAGYRRSSTTSRACSRRWGWPMQVTFGPRCVKLGYTCMLTNGLFQTGRPSRSSNASKRSSGALPSSSRDSTCAGTRPR